MLILFHVKLLIDMILDLDLMTFIFVPFLAFNFEIPIGVIHHVDSSVGCGLIVDLNC